MYRTSHLNLPYRLGQYGNPPRKPKIELVWPDSDTTPPLGPRCESCKHAIEQPATGRRRKYCSDACRQKGHRTRQRDLHPGRFEIARDYRRAERQLAKIEKKHGRLDETPIWGPNSTRDYVLLRLANNYENDICRICQKPLVIKPNTGLGYLYCSQRPFEKYQGGDKVARRRMRMRIMAT